MKRDDFMLLRYLVVFGRGDAGRVYNPRSRSTFITSTASNETNNPLPVLASYYITPSTSTEGFSFGINYFTSADELIAVQGIPSVRSVSLHIAKAKSLLR